MAPTSAEVARRLRIRLSVGILAANTVGAFVVFGLAAWIVPLPHLRDPAHQVVHNVIFGVPYVAAALVVGTILGFRRMDQLYRWLAEGDQLTPARQVDLVLRGPGRLAAESGALWAVAVPYFSLVNAPASGQIAGTVAIVVAFGGVVTCSVAYLLAERALRESAGLVLASAEHRSDRVQSVAARQVFTWALSTGVPVLGLIAIGSAALAGTPNLGSHLPRTMVVLAAVALGVGLLATVVAARATADPVGSLRRAVDQVRDGDLDVDIPVYDGTEIGLLQAGFNRMAAGLREREELADLFGRHVGVEVARQALERGIELGGETRDVAVLFVDLAGSTALAAERPPSEVVGLLNRFFTVVVEVVEDHGGFVNKFEGDAALAIFGAPAVDPARHRAALGAARDLDRRLRDEVSEVGYGIGVASGEAVAGNIGSEHRLEYTVIGDPVNEAARLTDLAKTRPERVAASGTVVCAADGDGHHWRGTGPVTLRGRALATDVHVPDGGPPGGPGPSPPGA